jgi:hypothetical protein
MRGTNEISPERVAGAHRVDRRSRRSGVMTWSHNVIRDDPASPAGERDDDSDR